MPRNRKLISGNKEAEHSSSESGSDRSPKMFKSSNEQNMGHEKECGSGAAGGGPQPCTLAQITKLFKDQEDTLRASEGRLTAAMNQKFQEMEVRFEDMKKENESLRQENSMIKTRLIQLERDSRKCNIVVSGIDFTTPKEGFETLEKVIKNATGSAIKVSGLRTFTTKNGGKRIVAACRSLEDKRAIMVNKKQMVLCKENETTPVFLDDDLPREDQELQAKLREIARTKRKEGKKVRMGRNRINIDNSWFFLNPKTDGLELSSFQD